MIDEFFYDPLEHLYNAEFDLYRIGKVKQPAGNFKEGENLIYKGVKCRAITSAPKDERVFEDNKQKFVDSLMFWCSPKYEIRRNDHIHFNNEVYEVESVRNPAFMDHHLEIYCEKVR